MSDSSPTSPILVTKLHVPQGCERSVVRPRLIQRLDEAIARPLVVVSAPAGFGKSTLVGQWIARTRTPAAWLSLDSTDSDPARFLSYVAAALGRVNPALGESVRASLGHSQGLEPDTLLFGLLNEIAEFAHPLVLVLDDIHVIDSPDVFEGLETLLEHMPSNLHLVLVGREDPPLPIARLRARRAMAEIRIRDLRFTAEESAAYLNETMGLELAAEDITTLDARTEGWIAGLQLAALSLQDRDDPRAFIEKFGGEHRHIVDFLLDEVLSRQSEEVRVFLERTSILERLCAPLCESVTGMAHSRALLCEVEERNLFLLPLDDERTWYRYHGLFAGSLRQKLAEDCPEEISGLHSRASEWFEVNGLADEAVEHALRAQDFERAARLVQDTWGELINSSRTQTLWDRTTALPEDVRCRYPRVMAAQAWAAFLTQRYAELMQLVPVIQAALEVRAADGDEERETAGHLLAIRSFIARANGQVEESIELAEAAMAGPLEHATELTGALAFSLGWSYMEVGEIERAFPHLETAARADEHGNYYVGLVSFGLLGQLHLMRGDLSAAETLLLSALDAGTGWGGRSPLPATGFALAGLGDVAYERNLLDEADRYYDAASELAAGSTDHTLVSRVARGPLRLAIARSDFEAAHELLERETANQVEHHGADGRVLVGPDAMRLALAENDARTARTLQAHGPKPAEIKRVGSSVDWIPFARHAISMGEYTDVSPALEDARRIAHEHGLAGLECTTGALLALALDAAGRRDDALDALEEAVDIAERLEFVRSLLDLGHPFTRLLASLQATGRSGAYAEVLLAACADADGSKDGRHLGGGVLYEPLTEREAEVLAHIAEGRTYQAVADQLFLSVNTVRHHVKALYRKLDVNSANEAVARARKLGLL